MQNLRARARALFALAFSVIVGAGRVDAQAPAPGEIMGRLVDSASGRAVASGSIAVRRAGDSVFASGALPKADGSFRVDGLMPGRYILRIRAIGFAPVVRDSIVVTREKPVVDVGAIALNVVSAKLQASQVVAERE